MVAAHICDGISFLQQLQALPAQMQAALIGVTAAPCNVNQNSTAFQDQHVAGAALNILRQQIDPGMGADITLRFVCEPTQQSMSLLADGQNCVYAHRLYNQQLLGEAMLVTKPCVLYFCVVFIIGHSLLFHCEPFESMIKRFV